MIRQSFNKVDKKFNKSVLRRRLNGHRIHIFPACETLLALHLGAEQVIFLFFKYQKTWTSY